MVKRPKLRSGAASILACTEAISDPSYTRQTLSPRLAALWFVSGITLPIDPSQIVAIAAGCPSIGENSNERNSQEDFLPSNSDLRLANGEYVAPLRSPEVELAPPVASNCRWCSLSWQYRHKSSQLLPSVGLLS